jgi:hypothetical protein
LAKRGRSVKVNQKFWRECRPLRSNQNIASFKIYYSPSYNAKFCNEPGMKELGTLKIRKHDDDIIEFSLTFFRMEIKATAKNKRTGVIYNETTFTLDI